MGIKYLSIALVFITFLSCSKKDRRFDTYVNLHEYIALNASQELGEVIACAASAENDIDTSYIFYYPLIGATDIKYFETESSEVNSNDFLQYSEKTLAKETVFNGKLERFVKNSAEEVWCIVTFKVDGKLHKSNPIRLKNKTRATEWGARVDIDTSTFLMPKFSWEDGTFVENAIYFQVISDIENNFLSGTYTYDKWFQYFNLSNVVLEINTSSPPSLIEGDDYNFTLMGVSEDNWVNLVIQKIFIAE